MELESAVASRGRIGATEMVGPRCPHRAANVVTATPVPGGVGTHQPYLCVTSNPVAVGLWERTALVGQRCPHCATNVVTATPVPGGVRTHPPYLSCYVQLGGRRESFGRYTHGQSSARSHKPQRTGFIKT